MTRAQSKRKLYHSTLTVHLKVYLSVGWSEGLTGDGDDLPAFV